MVMRNFSNVGHDNLGAEVWTRNFRVVNRLLPTRQPLPVVLIQVADVNNKKVILIFDANGNQKHYDHKKEFSETMFVYW